MRALVVLMILVVPLASAALPAIPTDVVNGHTAYDQASGAFCSSYDPALGLASTDVASTFQHAESGAQTTYTVHLDATQANDAFGVAGCDAIDITFTTSLAWPPLASSSASFVATCGAVGTVAMTAGPSADQVQLRALDPPAACALPITDGVVAFTIQRVRSQTAFVCEPLVVSACAGAYSWTYPGVSPCGSHDASIFAVDVAGGDLVYGERYCHAADGRDHSEVGVALGLVRIDATSGSCTIVLGDAVGIAGDQGAPCPEAVRAAIYDEDWAHVLS